MSEAIVTALISAVASLVVAFGTWHVSMKKDREKQTEEVLKMLTAHREEYLSEIRDVKDDVSRVNATVQNQVSIIEIKIEELSSRVEKHNNVIERTFKLEQECALHEEKIKVANHRIDDLEHKTNEVK